MVDVKTFDSKEEMLEWLDKARAERNSRTLTDEQQGITWGGYAVRFHENLITFCRVETREELMRGEDPDTVREIERVHREGSVWAKCYSMVMPQGEWGYQHRSVLWPIGEETFLDAQERGWDITRCDEGSQYQINFAFHALAAASRAWRAGA